MTPYTAKTVQDLLRKALDDLEKAGVKFPALPVTEFDNIKAEAEAIADLPVKTVSMPWSGMTTEEAIVSIMALYKIQDQTVAAQVHTELRRQEQDDFFKTPLSKALCGDKNIALALAMGS